MPKEIYPFIEGYQAFRKHYFEEKPSLYDDLTRYGQKPKVLVIACSDSRVDPAILLNCQPGSLFVVRNVANLVPPYEEDQSHHGTSAALEFGICGLDIRHIIVFGHTQCGGITRLCQNAESVKQTKGFVSKWMQLALPAYQKTMEEHPNLSLEERINVCGQYSLLHSLEHLLTFPWIRQRVEAKELFLHAWNFELTSGMIQAYDPKLNSFEELHT